MGIKKRNAKPGIHCPVCDCPNTFVYESQAFPDVVVRERCCENGHRFVTEEFVESVK
jgi:transcriptional regulator NrdR family protein